MKTIMFSLLPAILLWLGSCCTAAGQVAQSDQITDDKTGQTIQADSSSNGKFYPVTVAASATSDVKLQFPSGAAGKAVFIQPLDGGTVSTYKATIDQSALLAFSFQVTDQPGVHRVIAIDPTATDAPLKIVGVVQFEVPNPPQ